MIIDNIKRMYRGWLIGNFEPCILKTKDFEIGILTHKKGEVWPKHFHKEAVEYNCLIEGKMTVQNKLIEPGMIFIFEKNEIADPIFLEDCKVLVIKIPSVIGDKYEI